MARLLNTFAGHARIFFSIFQERGGKMIGFIGLGMMGKRMASQLLKNGEKLIVYNRTKSKASALPLLEEGAKWADSPQAVAQKAETIFTMLTSRKAVEIMALGQEGFLHKMKDGSLWVDCSTVDPAFSIKMAKEAAKRGVRFLDAPVAGSLIPAEEGKLTFYVGGSQNDLAEVRPLLNIMGQSVQYKGKSGSGSAMKLVSNLLLGQTMTAFAEAIALGEGLGLEKENIINTLLGGGRSPLLS
ncbi:NAD(P)-dependent oxidoreductase [Terrilactibacillus sp. S3-3]|nr:NAD(P)-dependent oxidoreductase [Terrilactibacillus sp. S3-3]